MAIDYQHILGLPPQRTEHTYTARDTMLYALGVGAGLAAARNPAWLPFVYEKELAALPTMATILAYPGFWAREPQYGFTWRQLLHRDQSIEIHGPIPVAGTARGEVTIDKIYDRGVDKGALLCFSRRIHDVATGNLIATVRQVNLLRADGGFGGPPDRTPAGVPRPERAPDRVLRMPTSLDQALVYRLSGDDNPLHVDPAAAAAAGFARPILHGLATFGVVGLALVGDRCRFEPVRLTRLDARFASPVYPGETLEIELWDLAAGEATFEVRSVERELTVIRHGHLEYRP
jgi:acyl dehydratase